FPRILIADKDQDSLEVLVELLTKAGYSAEVAESSEETFDKLRKGNYCLVLVELRTLDGLEITRKIRSGEGEGVDPCVPVVALTTRVFEEDRKKCFEAGMNGHLLKPIDKEALMEVVARFSSNGDRFPSVVLSTESQERIAHRPTVLTPGYDFPAHDQRLESYQEGGRILARLQLAIKAGNRVMIEQHGQALRRIANAVGAIQLRDQALALISAARKANMPGMEQLLCSMNDELERLRSQSLTANLDIDDEKKI
ncbi:MAG: response regulator, partial [Magnetococcales bacterium]|nr:response regulator [Magnetococcales bacterium]